MRNKTKINRTLKGIAFFAAFAVLGANAYGQTSNINGEIAANDTSHSIIYDSLTAAGAGIDVYRTDSSDQAGVSASTGKSSEPELGKKIIEVTQALSQYFVLEEDASDKNPAGFAAQEENNELAAKERMGFGLALTSSYINNHLLDGDMKLEFHANPMEGGGAIFLRKTF